MSIVQACIGAKRTLLLLDMSEIHGTFTTMDRFELGVLGGRLSPHLTRVSIVAPRELIDPKKFGAQVARNRGLTVDVFADKNEALHWLLSPPAETPPLS